MRVVIVRLPILVSGFAQNKDVEIILPPVAALYSIICLRNNHELGLDPNIQINNRGSNLQHPLPKLVISRKKVRLLMG